MNPRLVLVPLVLVALSACATTSCPRPDVANAFYDSWEHELDRKGILVLYPRAKIDIKRDVHNVLVAADASALAAAFHDVLKDPRRRFGLIKLERERANIGRDFRLNERFQGRYELGRGLAQQAPEHCEHIKRLVSEPPVCEALWRFENAHTSDYGVITQFNMHPAPGEDYRIEYRYLEGSPIAGSSTFVVTPLGAKRSLFTQIFVYQEQTDAFAKFFSTGGLRLHNQVVHSQIKQAADAIHAAILQSDIPPEYQ